ncbi:MAG: arginine--tRNA ligase [bacterium]|nr:arginine--tRNA ligase [bacterium]
MEIKSQLQSLVAQAAGVSEAEVNIEHPEVEERGDFSTNIALVLGGGIKKAQEIASKLQADFIEKVETAGPGFINFKLKPEVLVNQMGTVSQIDQIGKGKTWLIEHTSPNPNKAMHLGHLRNNLTGMAIANIWEAVGTTVIRDDVDNNRGIAIAKLMWGYKKFGQNQTLVDLKLRPDRFVDQLYVTASEEFEKSEEVQKEIKQMVVDWEAEDKATRELWEKVLQFSYAGQEMTLQRLGNKWDKVWHEHEHYQQGKDLVKLGLEKGIFRKAENGTILTDLEKYHLPDTVVIKSDGTALYITQDLALTKLKRETFHPDRLHWCIGPEQGLALQQVFAVCEQLGIGKREDYVHIAYGYMSIKGKGKMSSRTGNVVYIDDLLDAAVEKAREFNADPQIAEKVGVGAVKYSVLKVGRLQDTAFDVDESVSLEGNSGPYLQYTYARTFSILAKAAEKVELATYHKAAKTALNPEELALLRWIYRYSETVGEAAVRLAPNLVGNFLYELAQRYNTFYNKHSILSAETAETKEFRLALTQAVGDVLESGLTLLGISVLEHM